MCVCVCVCVCVTTNIWEASNINYGNVVHLFGLHKLSIDASVLQSVYMILEKEYRETKEVKIRREGKKWKKGAKMKVDGKRGRKGVERESRVKERLE